MERSIQVFGGHGARERLVLRSSNLFMQPVTVTSHKKVSSIFSRSKVSVQSPVLDEEKVQQTNSPEKKLSFEEEQAAIASRNERERRQQIVSKHHKLALKANNMGVFQERMGRLDKALQCYQIALKAIHKTKGFRTTKKFLSMLPSTVIPQSPKTPIVIKTTSTSCLKDERTMITTVTLCNLGSMYRRSGRLGRAMEFYNLAYKIVGSSACDSKDGTDDSAKLQARILHYVEGNVKLVMEQERLELVIDSEFEKEDDSSVESRGETEGGMHI